MTTIDGEFTVLNPGAGDGIRDSATGRFLPGNRANPKGRPRKGESLPEKLRAATEKHADKIVAAALERVLRADSVGNRAFADIRDTVYGVPKQTLIVQRDDDPALSLLADLLEQRQIAATTGLQPEPRE